MNHSLMPNPTLGPNAIDAMSEECGLTGGYKPASGLTIGGFRLSFGLYSSL